MFYIERNIAFEVPSIINEEKKLVQKKTSLILIRYNNVASTKNDES